MPWDMKSDGERVKVVSPWQLTLIGMAWIGKSHNHLRREAHSIGCHRGEGVKTCGIALGGNAARMRSGYQPEQSSANDKTSGDHHAAHIFFREKH